MVTDPTPFESLQPVDPGVPIWRYMDFSKFVAMLEAGGLFMSRADKLGDPFEGTLSAHTLDTAKNDLNTIAPAPLVPRILDMQREHTRNFRQWITVNCWHMNQTESAAMWKLYSKSSDAISIKTQYSTLYRLVEDESVRMGCVRYVDFASSVIPVGNIMLPVMHKRLSFSHEHEVRLVSMKLMDTEHDRFQITAPVDGHAPGYQEPSVLGWTLPIDLSTLIESVYVSPESPDWFFDLVTGVCQRYGLPADVHRSVIGDDPFL